MNLDTIDNLCMLFAAIIGLIISLFRYIETPRRGYLYMSVFFLAHLLSDYYWTAYTSIMGDGFEVPVLVAYFGWNVGFVFLLLLTLNRRKPDTKKYFNILMLVPVPLNIAQLYLYNHLYETTEENLGVLTNNVLEVALVTAVAIFSIQSIMFFLRRRVSASYFPYFHVVSLIMVITQLGMWTSSCYFEESSLLNPYYSLSFATDLAIIFMPIALGKEYAAEGKTNKEKNSKEKLTRIGLRVIAFIIITGGCIGGLAFAQWMKNTIPENLEGTDLNRLITIVLMIISGFLVLLVLGVLYVTASHYKFSAESKQKASDAKRSRFNLVFTLLVTLGLMIFAVVYNSRVIYKTSVTALYETGEDKAATTATDMENYLSIAKSTLFVAADSVELMIKNGEPQEKINQYLTVQTQNQFTQFDENFTGIYAYVRGEYMDGSGWIPPEDYNVEERDWYRKAVDAGGKVIIVSPYVDAQTNSVVITICRLLDDGKEAGSYEERNVVALDVIVNHIQDVTEEVEVGGKGYAMIINDDGLIVAHKDRTMNGKNVNTVMGQDFLAGLLETKYGRTEAVIGEDEYTLFLSQVMDQWFVAVVVSNDELFADTRSQLRVNVFVSLTIFALISFFYYLGYKNEQAYSRKMEELNAIKQKQEYEAEVLRLEKVTADEANKAKSSFLADMSHEIRTPINAILGMNEMILRESDNGEVSEYAKNIKNSGRNLLALINSILDFSKIEDGKMEIVPVRYSVSALITYLINSVQEKADAKGLTLNVNIDPSIPSELNGDDMRINQIILNLLTNAVKYTPEGSVTLNVELRERKGDRIKLFIEVKDTGIGIKESEMAKLFESFERLDEIRNRNIEGTGLGMSIATKLLGLMGSELKVKSKYGEGSSFSFELWQKVENEETIGEYRMSKMEDESAGSYRESFHAPNARLLIVDDTKMNIVVAVNLLKNTRIKIDTALNGEDAIQLASDNAYDVILMDQRMPGMDGTQTLAGIRALENGMNAETPVICLTADAIRGARERYMAEGFDDYLTKPVDGRSLEKMLITYLPKDKVETGIFASDNENHNKDNGKNTLFAALKKVGVNTRSGLNFCMNDEELYRKVLSEYITESQSKRENLENFYKLKDWANYTIYVHSLKSTSKTIGAQKLSEMAAILENASKEKNEMVIENRHADVMQIYEDLVSVIRDNIKSESAEEYSEEDDDFIMEFAPEDEVRV